MKTLQINNSDNSIVVRYLTDIIGDAQEFTIYQVETVVAGVAQIGLTDAILAEGFFYHYKTHTLPEFIDFVKGKGYTLKSYENTATGSVETTIWSSGYGEGGAIGEDQL
jgi:hypothetical protein